MKKYLYLALIIIFIHAYSKAQNNVGQDMVIDPESIKLLNDQIKTAIPIIKTNPTTPPAIVAPPVITKTNPGVATNIPVINGNNSGANTTQSPTTKTKPESIKANDNNNLTKDTPLTSDQPKKDQTNLGYIYSDWKGSIMFDNSLIQSLNSALLELSYTNLNNKTANAKESKSNDVKSILDLATKNNISPSFYLGSIIFHSDKDWTIWINNKKITAEKRNDLKFIIPQLECIDVNEDYITFSWKSRMIDTLSPNWKEKLSLVKNTNNYYNKTNGITIKDNEVINFILYPNQTLSIYDMDIFEGYVPEHINITQKQEVK